MPVPNNTWEALAPVREALIEEFGGRFSPETIDQFVRDAATVFHDPTIAAYLPDFVRRYAHDLLSALAQSSGIVPKTHPEVLFVCVKNAGRSQMAAAMVNHYSNGRVHARCAGTDPANELHAGVADVMAELGVPVGTAFPKPLHRRLVEAADVVVTMGCGDACPILPGRAYEDWNLPDPVGMPRERLRDLRDEIQARVRALITRLTNEPA